MQCKQWKAVRVGVTIVRELYGVMAAHGAVGGFVLSAGLLGDAGRNGDLLPGENAFTLKNMCSATAAFDQRTR